MHVQPKWHCCFNKDHNYVAGPCKLYSYLLQIFIMIAVLGFAVGPMIRQRCDCVVHGREVWTCRGTDVQLT